MKISDIQNVITITLSTEEGHNAILTVLESTPLSDEWGNVLLITFNEIQEIVFEALTDENIGDYEDEEYEACKLVSKMLKKIEKNSEIPVSQLKLHFIFLDYVVSDKG